MTTVALNLLRRVGQGAMWASKVPRRLSPNPKRPFTNKFTQGNASTRDIRTGWTPSIPQNRSVSSLFPDVNSRRFSSTHALGFDGLHEGVITELDLFKASSLIAGLDSMAFDLSLCVHVPAMSRGALSDDSVRDLAYGTNLTKIVQLVEGWHRQHPAIMSYFESQGFSELPDPLDPSNLDVFLNCPLGTTCNTGEGGLNPISPFQAQPQVGQIGSGGVGITDLFWFVIRALQLKLSQDAKPGKGGQVDIEKILESKALAEARGLIPPDLSDKEFDSYRLAWLKVSKEVPNFLREYNSPQSLRQSIEELIQLLRFGLSKNPNLVGLSVKCAADPELHHDIPGLVRLLYTAATSTEISYEKLKDGLFWIELMLAGEGGGTGLTQRYIRDMTGRSNLDALIKFLNVCGSDPQRPDQFVRVGVDGRITDGNQVAILWLIRHLLEANHDSIQFYLGFQALIEVNGCQALRKCQIPGGCTVGVASNLYPENYKGDPLHATAMVARIAKEAADYLAGLGVNSENNNPTPEQILEIFYVLAQSNSSVENYFPIFQDIVRKRFPVMDRELLPAFDFKSDTEGNDYNVSHAPEFYSESGNFITVGDYAFASTNNVEAVVKERGADFVGAYSNHLTLIADLLGNNAFDSASNAYASVLYAGDSFGNLARNNTFMSLSVGVKAFSAARSANAIIWGLPSDYDSNLGGNLLNPTIGGYLGERANNLRVFTPKKVYESHSERFDSNLKLSKLTDDDCIFLARHLIEYLKNIKSLGNVDDVSHLLSLQKKVEDGGASILSDLFCKNTVGLHIDEFRKLNIKR